MTNRRSSFDVSLPLGADVRLNCPGVDASRRRPFSGWDRRRPEGKLGAELCGFRPTVRRLSGDGMRHC